MKNLIIIFSFLLTNCDNCKIDKRFKDKFDEQINTLALFKSNGITLETNLEKIKSSSEILLKLTGHKANISYNYTATYSDSNFTKDIKFWNYWYQENKCEMTESDFNKITNSILE